MGLKRHKKIQKQKCPCCNYKTVPKGISDCICPVCAWQADGIWGEKEYSAANGMTLQEGRRNFLRYGVCNLEQAHCVRAPLQDEQ